MKVPRLMAFAAGFGVWSIAFVVIYAGQHLGCRAGLDAVRLGPLSLQRMLLALLALAALAASLMLARRMGRAAQVRQGPEGFVSWVSSRAAYASAAAIAFTFAGIAMVSSCG